MSGLVLLDEGVAGAVGKFVREGAGEVGTEVGTLRGWQIAALHYELGYVAVVAGATRRWRYGRQRTRSLHVLDKQRVRHRLELVRAYRVTVGTPLVVLKLMEVMMMT